MSRPWLWLVYVRNDLCLKMFIVNWLDQSVAKLLFISRAVSDLYLLHPAIQCKCSAYLDTNKYIVLFLFAKLQTFSVLPKESREMSLGHTFIYHDKAKKILRSNVCCHHFYLPKVIVQVQTGLEYSAFKYMELACWVLHCHFGPVLLP